jgi:AmiR/NasT family two-component response regulator
VGDGFVHTGAARDDGIDPLSSDAVAVALLRDRVARLSTRVDQLQTALDSRVVIEQAKGLLAERLGVGVDDAFEVLRSTARSRRVRLHELASQLLATREWPPAT